MGVRDAIPLSLPEDAEPAVDGYWLIDEVWNGDRWHERGRLLVERVVIENAGALA